MHSPPLIGQSENIASQLQILTFCLLCENRSGPFKYFPLSITECQTLSVEGAREIFQEERLCFLVLRCSLGRVLQCTPHCLVPAAQGASRNRLLKLLQDQAPTAHSGLQQSNCHDLWAVLRHCFTWDTSSWTIFPGAMEGRFLASSWKQISGKLCRGSITVTSMMSNVGCGFSNSI